MKIALVTKPDQHMTGLLRYALNVYQPLRARGVDIRLVHPRLPLPSSLLRFGKRLHIDAAAFFASYPVSARLDGASICHLSSQTLATLLLFQRLPATVVTVHDLFPPLAADNVARRTDRREFERCFDGLAQRGLARADALIAVSHYTKRCILSTLAYPADRIQVIYEAANTEVFKPLPVPLAFRRKYGLDETQQLVLYVGSEDPRKNLATLIRAFAIVHERLPWARLIKVGAACFDAERDKVLQLVAGLGLAGRVRFLDHVLDQDLPLLYNAAHVLVLPSFYEGFGLPALEAMSCGTPVIASNCASLPEVVGNGGVLVDPHDEHAMAQHMLELLMDPERRAAASKAATEQAALFSLEREAEETMALYRDLG